MNDKSPTEQTVWKQTFQRHAYCYLEPSASSIDLLDIALGLSRTNRFNGHTTRPLSVAEHSLGVASMVYDRSRNPSLTLGALLHDAAEAYVSDLPAPLKKLLGERYRKVESAARVAICEHFNVHEADLVDDVVRQADMDALITERDVLMSGPVKEWGVPGEFNESYADQLKKSAQYNHDYWLKAWLDEVAKYGLTQG